MNLDNTHLTITMLLSKDHVQYYTALDVMGTVKHEMSRQLAQEIEQRVPITCRKPRRDCADFEIRADLWVFTRAQLDRFITLIERDILDPGHRFRFTSPPVV